MAIYNPKGPHHVEHETGGSDAIAAIDGSVITTGTVADARLSTNIARKDQTLNSFAVATAGNDLYLQSAGYERFGLIDTSQPANQRRFQLLQTSQLLYLAATDDSWTNVAALIMDRSGGITLPQLLTLLGGQIKFPATQIPSTDPNTIDDYGERRTFTPTYLANGVASPGATYSTQIGYLYKIGKITVGIGRIGLSAKGSGTGAIFIGGLPMSDTPGAITFIGALVAVYFDNLAVSVNAMNGLVPVGSTSASLWVVKAGALATTQLLDTDITNTFSVSFVVLFMAVN